ncbi:MAG: thiamine pyrophosphate-dependent enzyme [Dehalococcoidia bacterium]
MPIQPLDALRAIAEYRDERTVVVPTMTALQPFQAISPSDLNIPCIGFMGGASSLGLGLALAQPDRRVIVLDGDGSLMMQLGALATNAGAGAENFYHFVFKNGVYHVSGAQPIPSADKADFAMMAKGAGYAHTFSFDNLEDLRVRIAEIFSLKGPVFVQLVTEQITNPPQGGRIGGASFPQQAEAARMALVGHA